MFETSQYSVSESSQARVIYLLLYNNKILPWQAWVARIFVSTRGMI